MKINYKAEGDGFPDEEATLRDPKGKKIFLSTHIRYGSATGQLFGDRKNPMSETTITVDMNDDYSFGKNVKVDKAWDYVDHAPGTEHLEDKAKNKEMSVEEWNKLHQSRDPAADGRGFRDRMMFYRYTPGDNFDTSAPAPMEGP